MKRSLVFSILLLLLTLALAVLTWLYRDGLARDPGDSGFRLTRPLSAFPMPDGGFALVDSDAQRLVRFNATGQIRWEIPPRTLFGRFLSVDASPEGLLYSIDEIQQPSIPVSGPGETVQRLSRIGLDGSLGAVLLERRVTTGSGFIPGSLRMQDGELWYLYDDGTSVALASLDVGTLTEQVHIRTDWTLDRASLAPGGPGGVVAVAAEGGLALFQRDRFETLSEYAPLLPYPACIRYDSLGRLYIADPVAGVLLRLAPGEEAEVLLSTPEAPQGNDSTLVRGLALDNFTLGTEGIILINPQTNAILVVDPDAPSRSGKARVVRELSAFTVLDQEVNRSRLAWILLAGSLVGGLLFLVALIYGLVVHAPRPLAILGASLPGLLGLAAVLALGWYAGELEKRTEEGEAGLERLRTAAIAGAGALSGLELRGQATPEGAGSGILAPVAAGSYPQSIYPRGSVGWDKLRRRLAAMVEQGPSVRWPSVTAVLYLKSTAGYRYICDSDGLQIPGMVPALIPGYQDLDHSTPEPRSGGIEPGETGWASAFAFLDTPPGEPSILLEMVAPVSQRDGYPIIQRLASLVSPPSRRTLLVAFLSALALCIGLPLLVAINRSGAIVEGYRRSLEAIADKRQAVAAIKAGKADEARLILEQVVKVNPEDLQARNNLGAAYSRLGMLEEARDCFDAVIRSQPDNAVAQANLGRLRDRLAKRQAAARKARW